VCKKISETKNYLKIQRLKVTHLEAEEQAASVKVVGVLVDAEGALSGDPECELVELHVQHLVVVMEDLHVAQDQEELCKSQKCSYDLSSPPLIKTNYSALTLTA
jgi:hypothetical protein